MTKLSTPPFSKIIETLKETYYFAYLGIFTALSSSARSSHVFTSMKPDREQNGEEMNVYRRYCWLIYLLTLQSGQHNWLHVLRTTNTAHSEK